MAVKIIDVKIKNTNTSLQQLDQTVIVGQSVFIEVEVVESDWKGIRRVYSTWQSIKDNFTNWLGLKNW